MKSTVAANVSLVLAIIGAPLLYWGLLSSLGDPAPWVTPEQIAAMRAESFAMTALGAVAWIASVWLSGYGFTAARLRASVALLMCVATLAGFWFI